VGINWLNKEFMFFYLCVSFTGLNYIVMINMRIPGRGRGGGRVNALSLEKNHTHNKIIYSILGGYFENSRYYESNRLTDADNCRGIGIDRCK